MNDQMTPERQDFLAEVEAQLIAEHQGADHQGGGHVAIAFFPAQELEPGLALEPAPEP